MTESSIVSTELTKDEFRRRFRAGLIAAWLIPPATGELGMTFLGFWELGEAGLSLIRFTGIYIVIFTLIAFFVFKRLVIEPVVVLGDRQPALVPAHTRRLKAFPWIFWGLLGLYSAFGPATVFLSNAVFQGTQYTLGQYAFSVFGVIPFLLISAFPLFFYLTDLLGRFLAPRGVSVMVAPLWLKVTVLGLFTPVTIDTILLTYYYNRTGFLTIETLLLWFVLVLMAGVGTWVVLRSFHQGMHALKQPLGDVVEMGNPTYPVPSSLDEFGLLTRGWSDLLKSRDYAERKVRERDKQVRDIVDNTNAVIYIKDKAGRYLMINRRFEQLFNISNDDAVGKTDHDIFPKEYADAFRQNDLTVIHDEKPLEVQEIAPYEDGPHTYISQRFPLYDADQVLYGVCGISTDITERLQADEKLRQSEARLSGIIQVANDAIITVDYSQKIVLFNQGAERVFGYSQNEVLGHSLDVLLPERFRNKHRESIKRFGNETVSARQMSERPISMLGCRKNGEEFPLEASISKLDMGGEKIFTVALRDITERKARIAELEHLAMYDSLTDLPNRTLLQNHLEHAINVARNEDHKVALIVLHLVRFKEINDTLGYHNGDRILQDMAKRLGIALKEETVTVARLGGNEFAVVLPVVRIERATQVVHKLEKIVEMPFSIQDTPIHIEIQAGIALYPDHADEPTELIKRADVALRMAEEAKSNFTIYDADRDPFSMRRLTLFGELREAISQDELILHYQPQIEMKTNNVIAVEALARWPRPKEGMISPGEFIPLAEHTGLIGPLTLLVLNTAARQCQAWGQEDLNIKMSINLSTRNLQDPELPDWLSGCLSSYGVSPDQIVLEITESAIMSNPELAMDVLKRLKAIGLSLSIDDFGTGHSSLTYLRKLPVDEIKVDRSFVADMTKNENDRVIVRSTIDLAHNLGLKVVAEGVEDRDTWEQLAALGCDIAQGYYISRPVAASKFIHWLHEHPLDSRPESFGTT